MYFLIDYIFVGKDEDKCWGGDGVLLFATIIYRILRKFARKPQSPQNFLLPKCSKVLPNNLLCENLNLLYFFFFTGLCFHIFFLEISNLKSIYMFKICNFISHFMDCWEKLLHQERIIWQVHYLILWFCSIKYVFSF